MGIENGLNKITQIPSYALNLLNDNQFKNNLHNFGEDFTSNLTNLKFRSNVACNKTEHTYANTHEASSAHKTDTHEPKLIRTSSGKNPKFIRKEIRVN